MKKRVYSLEKQHKLKLDELNVMKQLVLDKKNVLSVTGSAMELDERTTLKHEIRQLSMCYIDKKSEYFRKAGNVLHEYYKKDLVCNDNRHSIGVDTTHDHVRDDQTEPTGMIMDMINTPSMIGHGSGKKTLLDQYMTTVSDDYELSIHEISGRSKCSVCGSEMSDIRNDAEILCIHCGNSEHLIIDSDRKSYKDAPPDMVYYAYKRMNHFNELMQQFQGKENNISLDIYDAIRKDLVKKQFTNLDELTPKFMRSVLKKLNLSTYYSNIPHIIHKLNGKPILILTPEQDNQLRQMFIQLQEPFKECCPEDRSNWPHYHYTFYKMFELLSLDQFLHCFPKLKNPYLIYNLDKIWKCMCTKLNWEFIQTGRD
jgi:hypothetical protein